MEIFDEGVFEFGFEELSGVGQTKEFKQHRIADEIARRDRQSGDIFCGFFANGLAVLAGEKALIIERADLSIKSVCAPVLAYGLIHIPLTGRGIFYPE